MVDIAEVLAVNMRRLRSEKGLTQQQLADKSKLSMGTIQGYEGKRRWPEKLYLEAIAKALSVPETEFFVPINGREAKPSVMALLIAMQELEIENKKLANQLNMIPLDILKFLSEKTDFDVRRWTGVKAILGMPKEGSLKKKMGAG
jgi:transcriptional regulator with XRE-family HTH domain